MVGHNICMFRVEWPSRFFGLGSTVFVPLWSDHLCIDWRPNQISLLTIYYANLQWTARDSNQDHLVHSNEIVRHEKHDAERSRYIGNIWHARAVKPPPRKLCRGGALAELFWGCNNGRKESGLGLAPCIMCQMCTCAHPCEIFVMRGLMKNRAKHRIRSS